MSITVDTTTQPVNLVWLEGDTQAQTFRFLNGPDTPWDLSSVFISAEARSTLGVTTALTVQVDDPASGELTIHAPLQGLDPDVYDYDIQFNDGHRTATYIRGRLQVRKDVTP